MGRLAEYPEGRRDQRGRHAHQEPAVKGIPETVKDASSILADTGYVNIEAFERFEADGKELYVTVSCGESHSQRRYDNRPKSVTEKPSKVVRDHRLLAMPKKLKTDAGRAL